MKTNITVLKAKGSQLKVLRQKSDVTDLCLRKISLSTMRAKGQGKGGARLEAKGPTRPVTRGRTMVARIGRWQRGGRTPE